MKKKKDKNKRKKEVGETRQDKTRQDNKINKY